MMATPFSFRRARLFPIVLLGLGVAGLAAQDGRPSSENPQQPTFAGGVQYVRVDVYVTRDGQLVDDLRPDEIALFEDGVPQTIDTFERIEIRPPDPLDPGLEPRTLGESRRLAADPRSRVFVIFLDPWHAAYASNNPEMAATVQRRFPIMRELEAVLGPDDLVAVMTPAMRPDDLTFTRGVGALARIEGDWFAPSSVVNPGLDGRFDDVELLYQACYPPPESPAPAMIARRREKMTLDALDGLAVHLGELREERKAVLVVTDGWRLHTPDAGMGIGRNRGLERPGLPIGGRGREGIPGVVTERGAVTTSGTERARCDTDLATLAGLDHAERLQEIARRANRSNVSFYPISPQGLTAGLPSPGAGTERRTFVNTTRAAVQSSLRELAEATDGLAIVNSNNLEGGLERIVADSSAYYLIGYASTNPVLDGRYRRIAVEVSRPGVHVRARPGYVAAPPPARPEIDPPEAAPVRSAIAAALDRLGAVDTRASLHLRDAAWALPSAGGPVGGFWLVGELDAQVRSEAGWTGGATADIAVEAPDGTRLVEERIDVPPRGPMFAVRVPDAGSLAPGDYTVRIRVQGTGAAARIVQTARVAVPSEPAPLGEPVLWRRGPSTGTAHVPTADPRFRRNERLRLELPALAGAPVTARLLDRTGAPLAVPLRVADRDGAADALRWVVIDLTLAPLAAGDYAVEVTQADAVRLTAFKLVP